MTRPYGFAQNEGNASTSWPGILATNQYTGETEPYTGHIPVADFIADVMVPQQEILAYDYETEIMWCDCGAANGSAGCSTPSGASLPKCRGRYRHTIAPRPSSE